jgi:DNA invertase Pin-like site-specific DNA recombinase
MSNLKTLIYCRISSIGQTDGVSLDAQLDECQKVCQANKLAKPLIVQEVSSAYESVPPSLQSAVGKRNYRFVFYAVDRFSRNVALGIELAKQIFKNHSVMIFLREKLLIEKADGPSWLTFVNFLTQAEAESKAISARVKGAIAYLKRNGYHHSGHAPYGYSIVPDAENPKRKRLIENPEEQKVIAYIKLATTRSTPVASINKALKAINNNATEIVIEHEEQGVLKKLKHPMEHVDVAYFIEDFSSYRGKPWTGNRIASVLHGLRKRDKVQSADIDVMSEEFGFMLNTSDEEQVEEKKFKTPLKKKTSKINDPVEDVEMPDVPMRLTPSDDEVKIDQNGWEVIPPQMNLLSESLPRTRANNSFVPSIGYGSLRQPKKLAKHHD